MQAFLLQVFAGLSIGSVLLLIAIGLSMTFGQMGVINMAHGELIMAGAYTAFTVQQVLASTGVSLLLSIPIGFLVSGLIGLLLEVALIRWMYHRPLDTLLVTFGVSLILQQLARDVFGAPAKQVLAPSWLSGYVSIGSLDLAKARLFILFVSLAATGALAAVIKLTPLGRRLRASVQNRDLAETLGISTRRIDQTAFFIGSGLAGVAGVCLTLIGSTGPTIGTTYIVDAFLVVVVGGIGQIKGTVLAAFVLGMLQSLFEYTTSASIGRVIVLLLIVVFLQVRPQGLFTVRSRSLV
ncbi:urea ABC transporter permease subunit UrtB [Nocardioides ultimimeridianus]